MEGTTQKPRIPVRRSHRPGNELTCGFLSLNGRILGLGYCQLHFLSFYQATIKLYQVEWKGRHHKIWMDILEDIPGKLETRKHKITNQMESASEIKMRKQIPSADLIGGIRTIQLAT